MRLFLVLLVFVAHIIGAHDILVKVDKQNREAFLQKTLKAGDITFSVQPLIKTRTGLGSSWYIAKANQRSTASPWDLAHQLAEQNVEVAYAEPDRWPVNENYKKLAQKLTEINNARNDVSINYDEDWPYPDPDVFAWNLQDTHSQLKRARTEAAHKGGKRVRVAHFDTGYSPENMTTPKYLREDLQKNFVEGENENSAVDPGKKGFLEQPGHGTSTLSVLAGGLVDLPEKKYKDNLGGAPEVELVPIRLSKSVILFQVSVFAKALYYCMENDCDVVSMSMGGVASKLWAEAVNDAYDNGMIIVTAAGNNVMKLPTHYLVYPAKFKRVISVCGVNYDHQPYFREDPWWVEMQGNWGPEVLMKSAIAAYTPNVPSARFSKPNQLGNGGGTSAATPQIGATAALWLQKNKDFSYDHAWQRVNSVHNALFTSATKEFPNSKKYFGNGVVRAADALKIAPKLDKQPIPKDEVSMPFLSVLFGWETIDSGFNKQMIEVEMLQLEQGNPELCKLLEQAQNAKSTNDELKTKIRNCVKNIPEASKAVIEALEK